MDLISTGLEELPIPPHREIIKETDAFEIVRINWTDKSATAKHDHGFSQCHVLIESGHFQNTFSFMGKIETQILHPGEVISTPLGVSHQLICLSNQGQTLHVYSPKISNSNPIHKFDSSISNELMRKLELNESFSLIDIQKLFSDIENQTISTESPYFMNQLFSGSIPHTFLAQKLASAKKTTLATREASPIFSKVEDEVVQSLGLLMGWNLEEIEGTFVPGGSASNFMALHCARQKKFPQFKTQGMNGQKFKIFTSSDSHYSVKKACVALGFGLDSLVEIKVDKLGKMDVSDLEYQIRLSIDQGTIPLLVCATAGTTVKGAFDPLENLSLVCQKYQVWLHVDAAWGGPALFSNQLKSLMSGSQFADSLTFDAHKLFGTHLTCSFFLNRHRGILIQANDVSGGEYLFHDDLEMVDLGKMSWQCGRGADAFEFWTLWKNMGTSGLGNYVDQFVEIRDELIHWILDQPRLCLINQPEYLNICVRVLPPNSEHDSKTWSQYVRNCLKKCDIAMVNYFYDHDGFYLRLILANPKIQIKHIKEILNSALEIK